MGRNLETGCEEGRLGRGKRGTETSVGHELYVEVRELRRRREYSGLVQL